MKTVYSIASLVTSIALLSCSIVLASNHDVNRVLTPSADSVTAVTQTGVTLSEIKSRGGYNHLYRATGLEKVDWVKGYSRVTKKIFLDKGHNHHFAEGSVLWMNSDGIHGVAEGCLNEFAFLSSVTVAPAVVKRDEVELEGSDEPVVRTREIVRYMPAYDQPPPQQPAPPTAPIKKESWCGGKCKAAIFIGIGVGAGVGIAYAVKSHDNKHDNGNIIINNSNYQTQSQGIYSTAGQTSRGTTNRTTTSSGKVSAQRTTPTDRSGFVGYMPPVDGRQAVNTRAIASTGTQTLNLGGKPIVGPNW
jgi:hypothetical protein